MVFEVYFLMGELSFMWVIAEEARLCSECQFWVRLGEAYVGEASGADRERQFWFWFCAFRR